MKTTFIYLCLAFSLSANAQSRAGGAIPVRFAHATGSITANSNQEICHIDASVPVYDSSGANAPWGQPVYIECKATVDGKPLTLATNLVIEIRTTTDGVTRKWLDWTTFVYAGTKPEGKPLIVLVTGAGTQTLKERYFSVYTERSADKIFVMKGVNIDDQDIR